MKLIADLHTHSKHSRFFHGKSTVMQMIMRANELGLKELAITDHSYRHLFHTNKDKLYDARLTIDNMNSWSKTKVLLGVEADILNEAGEIDVDAETMAIIDILVVGYHRCIKTDFAGFFGLQKKIPDAKQKATNAFLNAISKYPISILSHINARLDLDLYQIGKACAEKGVMVEINNRHPEWTQAQMDDLLASGCLFIVCSDAHSAEEIGHVENCFDVILKYNIPTERIAGIEFKDDEMTEEHKEINILYDNFLRKRDKVEKQEKRQAVVREVQSNLSDEMERELQKIAHEQGLLYTRPNRTMSTVHEQDEVEFVSDSEFSFGEFDEDEVAAESEFAKSPSETQAAEHLEGLEETAPEAEDESAEGVTESVKNETVQVGDVVSEEGLNAEAEATEVNEKAADAQDVGKDEKNESDDGEGEGEGSKENSQSSEVESNPQGAGEEPSSKVGEKTHAERIAKVQSETLKRGGTVVVKNSKNKQEPLKDIEPDDMINMFSVNASQERSKASAKEIKEEQETQEEEKKSKPKKIMQGAFVDVSSLTGQEKEKTKKKK